MTVKQHSTQFILIHKTFANLSCDFLDLFPFLKLKYSWFTKLCQSPLYSKVTKLYTYTHFHVLSPYSVSQGIDCSPLCHRQVPSCFSRVWLSVTPWTVACQAPLSMKFSRQQYWNGLPFPLQGIFQTLG